MIKRLPFLLLAPSLALAQPVQQSGIVTPGHVAEWTTTGVVQDGGTAASGFLKSVGITGAGLPFGINDGPITAPYHALTLGALSNGTGLISYQAMGGATQLALDINVNNNCIASFFAGGTTLTGCPLLPNSGGTGFGGIPQNGQIPIGIGGVYQPNWLTPGTGISIVNGAGTVTISATGGTGTVTNIATGSLLTGGPITTTGTISVAAIAAQTVLGNATGSSAVPTAIPLTRAACYAFDSNTTVTAGTLVLTLPWTTGTVTKLVGQTGTGSFTGAVSLNGTGVTGCGSLTVNSTTPSSATCTAANTWSSVNPTLTLTVSSPSSSPNTASLCATVTTSP